MNEEVRAQAETNSRERDVGLGQEAMCPMASMCGGIARGFSSRVLLTLPGIVLVLIGIAIAVQPQVLVWLAATVAILLGVVMLVMAGVVYRFGRGQEPRAVE